MVAGIDGLRLGLHVCRGNWSRDETTLLSGSYQALRPYLDRLQVTQLVLEYATDRAGTLVAFEGKELGLGVVNPRTEQVETPAQIRSAVEEALGLYPAERVFLNPDCGFGTFSSRPMNTREIGVRQGCGHGRRGPRSARTFVRKITLSYVSLQRGF